MHGIQEKDWADDDWSSFTGMESDSRYCDESLVNTTEKTEKNEPDRLPPEQQLSLSYAIIRRGMAELKFGVKGREHVIRASYLTDPLLDLTDTAIELLQGVSDAAVVCMDTNGEHQLILQREDNHQLNFEVRWFEKWASWGQSDQDCYTLCFKGNTSTRHYCFQVLSVLEKIDREIGLQQYKRAWIGSDFPSAAYLSLKKILHTL
jgi:hypothetical protein